MQRLAGRIAVVTGAGAGIGRAIADLFAAEGAEVYVTDVSGETAKAAAEAIGARGQRAIAMTMDVPISNLFFIGIPFVFICLAGAAADAFACVLPAAIDALPLAVASS